MNFRKIYEGVSNPLREYYRAAGAVCAISTNCETILETAREVFPPMAEPHSRADVTMSFWVDNAACGFPPWPCAYFRGLSHLVFAAFDSENAVLVDLLAHRMIGRFSPAMAGDRTYWKTVILPTLFGIVSEAIGVTALHCACVAENGEALVLAGESGAGKSTLSLALAQRGFTFLSDDWTYFSRLDGRLLAWGLSSPLKLMPDAVEHFPDLVSRDPTISSNGEVAYEVDPELAFGVKRSACAEPRWLVFLERQEDAALSLTEMSPLDAAARLEEDLEVLPAAAAGGRDFLVTTIRTLVQRPCWLLRYGGTPQAVAQALSQYLRGYPIVGETPLVPALGRPQGHPHKPRWKLS